MASRAYVEALGERWRARLGLERRALARESGGIGEYELRVVSGGEQRVGRWRRGELELCVVSGEVGVDRIDRRLRGRGRAPGIRGRRVVGGGAPRSATSSGA